MVLEELIPLSHIIVVLPSVMESPLVVRIQRNKIVPTDSLKSFELVSIKVKPIDLNTLTPNLKMSLHVLNR